MNIAIRNLQKKFFIPKNKIIRIVRKVRRDVKLSLTDISLCFIGPRRMRRMNKEYLGHDYVTDVLAFDDGEIVICPSMAHLNAKRYQTSTQKELLLYVIHGLLHLAGYDDHKPKERVRMRRRETELLKYCIL